MKYTEIDSPYSPLEITHFRRFTRRVYNKDTQKVEILPTTTVQITVKGQFLSSEAKIYKVIYPIQTYYPQVQQCYRCFKFGHIKNNCKSSNEICIRCGENKHQETHKCPLLETQPKCLHCKQNHLPIDKSCPARLKEQNIKDTATKLNLTVAEVKKQMYNNKFSNNSKYLGIKNATKNYASQISTGKFSYSDMVKSGIAATVPPDENVLTANKPNRQFLRTPNSSPRKKPRSETEKEAFRKLMTNHNKCLSYTNGRAELPSDIKAVRPVAKDFFYNSNFKVQPTSTQLPVNLTPSNNDSISITLEILQQTIAKTSFAHLQKAFTLLQNQYQAPSYYTFYKTR